MISPQVAAGDAVRFTLLELQKFVAVAAYLEGAAIRTISGSDDA
jgi:hypothetical protein